MENWDRVKVYTTSAMFVEWIEFSRFPDSDKIKSLKNEIESISNEDSTHQVNSRDETLATLQKRLDLLQSAQLFRLTPVKSTATVNVCLDDNVEDRTLLKKVIITQIPIMMNDATTGHKL